MSYTLLRLPRAERQLTSLKKAHNQFVAAILRAIEGLGRDPRPPGVEKLVGRPEWRIRIGDYRVVYHIDDSSRTIRIVTVAHRREIYRQ